MTWIYLAHAQAYQTYYPDNMSLKLEISPLLLLLLSNSGIDPKESKTIYPTYLSYLSATQRLILDVGIAKWLRWSWSPTCFLCYLSIHSTSQQWEMPALADADLSGSILRWSEELTMFHSRNSEPSLHICVTVPYEEMKIPKRLPWISELPSLPSSSLIHIVQHVFLHHTTNEPAIPKINTEK